jgi:hypothetical protein
MNRQRLAAAWVGLALGLGGCAAPPTVGTAADIGASPWALQSGAAPGPAVLPAQAEWRHLTFPGKTATDFGYARKDGRDAIAVRAVASVSMLRRPVRIEPADLGSVRFSWRVPELIAGSDMAVREADDSPVRIVLVFEGDRSGFSPRDRMLSELARAVTGEELPYATLMYVWCNQREPGTVIPSPRTGRIRKLVVESGATSLDRWLDYERDIRADYQKVFGEPPGALVGIGIMSDSDNTRSTTSAWYGPLRFGRGVR